MTFSENLPGPKIFSPGKLGFLTCKKLIGQSYGREKPKISCSLLFLSYSSLGSGLSDDSNYDHACRSTNHLKAHNPPILYNLDQDPGERYPLDPAEHEDLLDEIVSLKATLESQVIWSESQISRGTSREAAPCCNKAEGTKCKPYPTCCDCQVKHSSDIEGLDH